MAQEIAVVVGVGPGLGWSLVKTFADAGMRVAAVARNSDKLDGLLAQDSHADVRPYGCDATDPEAVTALFKAVETDLGIPSLVVFNAGTYEPGGILDITPHDFERCWRTGCFGGFLVGQAAARLMVRQQSGSILFTGATASLRGGARFANLAVSKFGLRALAQSMARELGPQGVHVGHVIVDGQIEIPRFRDAIAQRGPDALLAPDEIARAFYQLHRQHRSAWTQELDVRPWVERF